MATTRIDRQARKTNLKIKEMKKSQTERSITTPYNTG